MVRKTNHLELLLKDFSQRTPVRTGSLIVSLFGDTLSQHGNSVWLGSIISALEPFGLNHRQIRTAVFRLAQDGWLVAKQFGRKSYYSYTEFGIRHYEKAARRIYAPQFSNWDGLWVLVIPVYMENTEKDILNKELTWLGYGLIANGVYAHPTGNRQSLDETLLELGAVDKVIVLESRTKELTSRSVIKRLVNDSWNLDEAAQRYDQFLLKFRPILQEVRGNANNPPEKCFQIRTLLIHEYRRILLHDADLPEELLPTGWSGKTAYDLTVSLYGMIHLQAIHYVMGHMESASGVLAKPGPEYYLRFGGLPLSPP